MAAKIGNFPLCICVDEVFDDSSGRIIPHTGGKWRKFSLDAFKSRGNHKTNGSLFRVYQLQQHKHIDNCMLLGGLDDQDEQDPSQGDDAEVHVICVNEAGDDDLESTADSDSGEGQDQRPSPEVEKRHESGKGSMGREDYGCGAAEKASTLDTGGAGSAQLVIPLASMCSGSSNSDVKEHAQDDES